MFRLRFLLVPLLVLAAAAPAQQARLYASEDEINEALTKARAEGQAAKARAEQFEADAARATEALEKTAQEAAGLAARIQQTEAKIAQHEAQIDLIERRRAVLRQRLAERQRPLVRLTAALQRLSQRPAMLSLLRPGTVLDAVHMRALLKTMLPEVERRTADLRSELEKGRVLQRQAQAAARELRGSEAELAERRKVLVALETRQRLSSRSISGLADREAERALALAERARDLDALAIGIGKTGELRQALASLPGPIERPDRPEQARVSAAEAAPMPGEGPADYLLPVAGRLVAGFGDAQTGQPRSRGITLAARPGAQVVSPAAGRVAFAGAYRGYGKIVIVEHDGGWTSLVTGLAQVDTAVGQQVLGGSPLGLTGAGKPVVTLELRRDGDPVNPLDHIREL